MRVQNAALFEVHRRREENMDHQARLKLFDAVRAEQGSFLEAILWRLTGKRELFAEALQESLLQVWRHLEKLPGPGGRAYLYRIAQSAAAEAWRKRMGAGMEVPENQMCPADRPEQQADKKELVAKVRRAISELPETQGRAITLRYLEQKDYDLMAREMDCSEVTLRSYVSKGLATLRNLPVFVRTDVREG
jgi:RNA polymerase sigma factor (sigma-70 family)